MGRHRDLVGILLIVIIAMFIPFLGSIAISYGFDFTNFGNWLRIVSTFGWYLLIFGLELIFVFLYFKILNKIANEKIKNLKP
jgi:hypothetical protein